MELSSYNTTKYKDSLSFINEIIRQKENGLKDEFFISYLAGNELFSAVRDEVRSIILFNRGVPVSRWRDSRNNPDISREHYSGVYRKILESFDVLFENNAISFIREQSPEDTTMCRPERQKSPMAMVSRN